MIGRSKTGLLLSALYVLTAAVLYFDALVMCKDGFLCGFEVFTVALPAAWIYWQIFLYFGVSPTVLSWELIIPEVATNAVLYYFLGAAVGAASKKLFKLFEVR